MEDLHKTTTNSGQEVPVWLEDLNTIKHPDGPDTVLGLLNTRGWDEDRHLEITNNLIKNNKITTIMILTEVQMKKLKTGFRNIKAYTKLRGKGHKNKCLLVGKNDSSVWYSLLIDQ